MERVSHNDLLDVGVKVLQSRRRKSSRVREELWGEGVCATEVWERRRKMLLLSGYLE